ncbi:hypothetical protein ACIOD2_25825 [Amycolatopsis sp. NPDC088138]|uniref:hypothetical protein n=1 Tax=Amycolatopsis sp. NPDC088138 TaxID=3363938 RepID=UPI003803503A
MMITYSTEQVVEMFGGGSGWWLRDGCRTGKFPYLKVRPRRFTDDHVKAIAAELETRAKPRQDNPLSDVSVFGATPRSATRHSHRLNHD